MWADREPEMDDAEQDMRKTEEEVWVPLEMRGVERAHLWVGTFMTYACVCADLAAGANYVENDTAWWHRWTLAFVFLPGLLHAFIQHTAVYKEPADRPRPGQVRLGECAPNLRPRRVRGAGWAGYWVATLMQLRTFVELVKSLGWNFQTGAWRDARVIQVCAQSVPQAVLQSWILFSDWGRDVDFDFNRCIVSMACAFANICFLPVGSPCCEDNRSLARVAGADGEYSDADSDDRSLGDVPEEDMRSRNGSTDSNGRGDDDGSDYSDASSGASGATGGPSRRR